MNTKDKSCSYYEPFNIMNSNKESKFCENALLRHNTLTLICHHIVKKINLSKHLMSCKCYQKIRYFVKQYHM